MTNVYQIPDSMQRQWRVFEGHLRKTMAMDCGCTAAEINYTCAQLKPIYLKYSQPKELSVDPNKVLLELNTWVWTQISGLLLTIAARDVELFRLRGGGDE